MQYLYCLANASLTLRVVEYFNNNHLPIKFITVISGYDNWIVNVKMKSFIPVKKDKDIRAFLGELGIVYSPTNLINEALSSLEAGQSVLNVMRRYQIVVVSHGRPQPDEIEVFRQDFIRGLGYCPQNLA